MKLNCKFTVNEDDSYQAFITSCKIKEPTTLIESIGGRHQRGKTNADVRGIIFDHLTVNFVPRGLAAIFPNMTDLVIHSCDLKSICRDDLKEYKNLELLWLGCNKLTTLPDDLFLDTPNLKHISFKYNKIEAMSSKLFQTIVNNELEVVEFESNVKIDANYFLSCGCGVSSLAELMDLIDSQCSKPSSPLPSCHQML